MTVPATAVGAKAVRSAAADMPRASAPRRVLLGRPAAPRGWGGRSVLGCAEGRRSRRRNSILEHNPPGPARAVGRWRSSAYSGAAPGPHRFVRGNGTYTARERVDIGSRWRSSPSIEKTALGVLVCVK